MEFSKYYFFQYLFSFLLVTQLDAFGSNKQLVDTKTQLDRSHNQCTNLETQLLVKDDFYASREKDMHDLHQSELLKGMCSKTKITVVFFFIIFYNEPNLRTQLKMRSANWNAPQRSVSPLWNRSCSKRTTTTRPRCKHTSARARHERPNRKQPCWRPKTKKPNY